MGRKLYSSHYMGELIGSKFPITYAIAMQHFLDLPELWELYGIWTLYYSIEYPY